MRTQCAQHVVAHCATQCHARLTCRSYWISVYCIEAISVWTHVHQPGSGACAGWGAHFGTHASGDHPDATMHSVSAGNAGPPIVFMPGYAAGAAFFYRNLQGLASHARVHLVDWLGTACSGRPPFPCKTREETEDWFVEALEKWREEAGLESMVLVGHSLGGYLTANYALRYPERVKHLVLVNPAGMVRPRSLRSYFNRLRLLQMRASVAAPHIAGLHAMQCNGCEHQSETLRA